MKILQIIKEEDESLDAPHLLLYEEDSLEAHVEPIKFWAHVIAGSTGHESTCVIPMFWAGEHQNAIQMAFLPITQIPNKERYIVGSYESVVKEFRNTLKANHGDDFIIEITFNRYNRSSTMKYDSNGKRIYESAK